MANFKAAIELIKKKLFYDEVTVMTFHAEWLPAPEEVEQ